jgi:hypothetical protein
MKTLQMVHACGFEREREREQPIFLVFQKEMRKADGPVFFFILLQIDLGGPVLQCLPAP